MTTFRRSAWRRAAALALLLPAALGAQSHLTLDAKFVPAKAAPGETVTLVVGLDIEPGWHVYGRKDPGPSPTVFEFAKDALQGLVPTGPLEFDDGIPHETLGLKNYWVIGSGTLKQAFTVPAAAKPGKLQIDGVVSYMACNEQSCDPPATDAFRAALEITAKPAAGGNDVAGKEAPIVGPKLTGKVRVVPATARPGDTVQLRFECELAAGFHVYGRQETTGFPPAVGLDAVPAVTAKGAAVVPEGESHAAAGETSYWVAGKFEVTQELQVAATATAGEVVLTGKLDYMVCDESTCLPPAVAKFRVPLTVTAGAAPQAPQAPQAPAKQLAQGDGKVAVQARIEPQPLRAGETGRLVVAVTVVPGWHVYGTKETTGIPVSLALAGTGGLVATGAAEVPPGEQHDSGVGTTFELAGTFELVQELAVPAGQAAGKVPLTGVVRYMACDESSCLDATEIGFAVDVVVEAGAARTTTAPAGRTPPTPTTNSAKPPAKGDELSLLQIILECIAGGLLALAMPCTYPMIPITFSFFTKQAEQRHGKVLPLALTYGLGIVLMFVLIGFAVGPVIIPFAAHWATNAVLAVAFVAFALSLFGLFTLQLPGWLQNAAGSAGRGGGIAGVFFMGATLVVSSFTCTGPVVALLLARAAQGSDQFGVAVGMAAFGATMAVPFVFLSLLPGRVKKLPRSGEWMQALKVTLGFVELAAATKFFSNVDVYFDWQVFPRELFLCTCAAIFLLTTGYLFGVGRHGDDAPRIGKGRATTAMAFFLLAFYFLYGAMGFELDYISTSLAPPYSGKLVVGKAGGGAGGAGQEHGTAEHVIVWDDPAAALAKAKEQKKLLLYNFTGFA